MEKKIRKEKKRKRKKEEKKKLFWIFCLLCVTHRNQNNRNLEDGHCLVLTNAKQVFSAVGHLDAGVALVVPDLKDWDPWGFLSFFSKSVCFGDTRSSGVLLVDVDHHVLAQPQSDCVAS